MSSDENAIKVNISAGKDSPEKYRGQTKAILLDPDKFPLVGKIIGETFNGAIIRLPGYEFKITGGSDRGGIPMRKDVHGPMKKRVLLAKGPCYRPPRKGMKKRKMVRGNEITDEVTQVNCVVVKFGKEKIFDAKEE
jgi:small subunit ribosomal protein S6e